MNELPTDKGAKFLFRCECGKEFIARSNDVRKGRVKSCGCVNRRELIEKNTKHGLWKHPIYHAYQHMKDRCYNCKNQEYKDYGGRGIKVCEEWLNNSSAFCEWAMTNGWKKGLTLDRINVDGDYEPLNCRWVDWNIQQNNKRNNKLYDFQGKKVTLSQISRKTGISISTLYYRINKKNLSLEDAIRL